jgi:hypothetical protein
VRPATSVRVVETAEIILVFGVISIAAPACSWKKNETASFFEGVTEGSWLYIALPIFLVEKIAERIYGQLQAFQYLFDRW